jgi:hypothetical protein
MTNKTQGSLQDLLEKMIDDLDRMSPEERKSVKEGVRKSFQDKYDQLDPERRETIKQIARNIRQRSRMRVLSREAVIFMLVSAVAGAISFGWLHHSDISEGLIAAGLGFVVGFFAGAIVWAVVPSGEIRG